MADGLFDSSSGGGGGGGGGCFYILVELPWFISLPLVVCMLIFYVWSASVEQAEYEEEQHLDRTVYVEHAEANLERWLATRTYKVSPDSLWMEEGSSWRNDNYHCKGGQFQTTDGREITFCCAVESTSVTPACMTINP